MAEIIDFPRARSRVVRLHAHVRETAIPHKWRHEYAEFDRETGMFFNRVDWGVDLTSPSEDAVAMLGRFDTEAEADLFIEQWTRDYGGAGPRGAA